MHGRTGFNQCRCPRIRLHDKALGIPSADKLTAGTWLKPVSQSVAEPSGKHRKDEHDAEN